MTACIGQIRHCSSKEIQVYERTTSNASIMTGTMTASSPRTMAAGLAGAIAFAGLTFVGANIVIPLFPVPITLQTLFVLLAGAAIGGRYGALGQALYIGAGAVGLPAFAGGVGGLAILGGPTGGYLLSFLVVPFVVSALLRHSRSIPWLLLSYSVATVVIFAFGVTHLAAWYTGDVSEAVRLGLLPFLPGAVFKIAAATSISRAYWALSTRRRESRTA
jgi:biotin transport system substrate-specific component